MTGSHPNSETVVGVLVVAIFPGPIPMVVVGTALTVCGFAGAQAVSVSLAMGR
ncbi:hypothetical protein [Nocardia sp. NPDC060249]|uniref:hypothetical protein n=1 Tax=Nocardia sp. NPDC060249 TaxID=3347082 RepID=UPI00365FE7F1